jgi:glycosyltransferase involved in cell wall biosynthesis
MNLLIDGQTLATPERERGIGVAFRRLCEPLVVADTAVEWFIAVRSAMDLSGFPPQVRARLHPLECVPEPGAGLGDEHTHAYSAALRRAVAEHDLRAYWNPNPLMLNTVLPTGLTGVPVLATIYDLIPVVLHASYLDRWPAPWQREYRARLAALPAWAERLLFVSNSARDDFVRLDPRAAAKARVVHLGVDATRFWPLAAPPDPKRDPYVLFTGGFDPRKNMEKALDAFAALVRRHPADFGRLSFVVVCDAPEAAAAPYRQRAAALGVADRLVLTGYVSDEALADLYRGAAAFFFPSRYEGFGLPVLEAMACGVPVVAAATGALPEIAGPWAEYCSAEDTDDMCDALARVLRRAGAPRQGVAHARQFTWARAAADYSALVHEIGHAPLATMERPRVAYVSPWPPARSGVASYSYALVPYLCRHFDLCVYTDGPEKPDAATAGVAVKPIGSLAADAPQCDAVIFHVGNNTTYHRGIYEAAWERPGIVVLHEVNIHPFLAHAFLRSPRQSLYVAALSEGYGAAGDAHARSVLAGGPHDVHRFPLSHALARRSRAVIVHNRWARRQLEGIDNLFVIPHGVAPHAEPTETHLAQLRSRLGIAAGAFVVSTLGYLQRFKRIPQLVAAVAHLLEHGYPVQLVLGGQVLDDGMNLDALASAAVRDHVTVTGYLSDIEFAALLHLSDVIVALRYPSLGETSGPLLRAFAAGKPCLVSDHGPFADYPDAVCWKVPPDELEVPVLAAYLEALLGRPDARRQLGTNAAFFARHYASLARTAEGYAQVVAHVLAREHR